MHFNAQIWWSCGEVKLIISCQAMVFGPGKTETAVRQSDVWIWQMVRFKSKAFSGGSNNKLWSQKCCFFFYSGGLLNSENESAGVQS